MKITNSNRPTDAMLPAAPEETLGSPGGAPYWSWTLRMPRAGSAPVRSRVALPDPPAGQVGVGDDAAVLEGGLLFATDVMTEGVHFDLRWSAIADVGWKALAVNLSDLAAMAGAPRAAVCAVVLGAGRKGEAD